VILFLFTDLYVWAEEHSEKLDCPERTVEIDEVKIEKRKYNRGRLVKGHWIFGV